MYVYSILCYISVQHIMLYVRLCVYVYIYIYIYVLIHEAAERADPRGARGAGPRPVADIGKGEKGDGKRVTLYVCVYIYIYIYTHTYIHTYIHT